jgi:hypothetical protein
MKTNPSFPSAYLEALTEDFFGPHGDTGPAAQAVFIPKLALFTAAVGVHLIAYGSASLLRRIHNHFNPPPPPAPPKSSPSLRGTPTPEDITDLWDLSPRALATRLRIGSRLADLEPTLDNTFVFKDSRKTRHRIVARRPGLKGWLRSNTPGIKYSTAMHYKKLATRLRQLIGLDVRIPLEWLLPGDECGAAQLASLPLADRRAVATARRKLNALLADNPKYSHLVFAVEQKLGIMRMATIRYIQPPKPGRGHGRRKGVKQRKSQGFSLVSRDGSTCGEGEGEGLPGEVVYGGKRIMLDGERTAAFWDAIRRILGETDPDPATLRLQRDIQRWLAAPLAARENRRR